MKIPILSQTNAILLATLIFKVKFQSKILRSKENTLSKEIIEGCLDQAIPYYMKLTMADTLWADKIVQCFEKHNLKEHSVEEAQD